MYKTELSLSKFRSHSAGPVNSVFAGLLLCLLAACGSAPVQEMSEARQAIEAARVAGAEEHATLTYEKAQSLLRTAEEMLNDRHFRKARESAAQARDQAIEAREVAQKAGGQ